MKNAFTMIELIFVIVILGILASVAVPKLAATRDDAKTAKIAQNITLGITEIASYAVANGNTTKDFSKMSNGFTSLKSAGIASLDVANATATISIGAVSDCVTIAILTDAIDENLSVVFGNAGSDSKCLGMQAAIDTVKYPMQLRGQLVKN